MKKPFLILLLLFSLLATPSLYGRWMRFSQRSAGFYWGGQLRLGPYKTFGSLYLNFRRDSKIDVRNKHQERIIFKQLISRSLLPRYLLLESTSYPMATLSSFLETDNPEYFQRFKFYNGLNIVRALCVGPEEPYSVSLFLGNILFYVRQNLLDQVLLQRVKQTGSAMAGFLLSYGHWHIQDNIRIDDHWYEIQYMLTSRIQESQKFKIVWDCRFGFKFHENPLAIDVAVFSFRRSHSDWRSVDWSVFRNSEISLRLNLPVGNDARGRPPVSRFYCVFTKKYPVRIFKIPILLKFGSGFVWARLKRFDRDIRQFETTDSSKLIWLIKPGVEF